MDQYKRNDVVWFGRCQWDEANEPQVRVQRGKIIKRDKTFVSEPWYDIKFDDSSRKLVPAKRLSDTELGAHKIAISQMEEDIDALNKRILAEQEERYKLYMALSHTKQEMERKQRGDPT